MKLIISVSFLIISVALMGVSFGIGLSPAVAQLPPTANIQLQDGSQPGEVIVSWDAVPQATYYRIGYVNMVRDYPIAKASTTSEWLEAFLYADVNARNFSVVNGRVNYTIRGLCQNTRHAVTVLTSSDVTNTIEQFGGQYYWPQDPRWQFIITADHGNRCPEVSTTPPSSTAPTAGDYDADNDGLIEVSSLAQLDAMRHDLDGDGSATHSDYAAAYPNALADMGCPAAGCTGYELTVNLDFDTNGSGQADAGDAYWNDNWGWTPVGDPDEAFRWNATFDGNGHTIANLYISWGDTDHVGLFRATGSASVIRNVGLVEVNVTGNSRVGGLVGGNGGTVSDSYATGKVTGNGGSVGGLVGSGSGPIANSYSTAKVTGEGDNVGGLAGHIGDDVAILASYAIGDVASDGSYAGGLIGSSGNNVAITASYATGNVSGKNYVGGLVGSSSRGNAITGSYATGSVTGRTYTERVRSSPAGRRNTIVRDGENIGGLVGYSGNTTITSTYAIGIVNGGQSAVGALVGGASGGAITVSYTANSVTMRISGFRSTSSRSVGGLIGSEDSDNNTSIIDSYWDTQVAGLTGQRGKTTRELQSPTANTGIYANWNANWWDFGTSRQYPVLKYGGLDVAAQRP